MTTIMPNEEQLLTVNDEELVLTNQRIQFEDAEHRNVELPLEQVNNVTIQRRGYKPLLISGSFCVLAGILLLQNNYNLEVVLIAGIMMLTFWYITRKRTIDLTLTKGKVASVDVDELSSEEIQALVNGIQSARNNRISEMGLKAAVKASN